MGSNSGGDSKAYWQGQIDNMQNCIDMLKRDNARDRENAKNNPSNRATCRSRIEQRTKEIKNKQEQLKKLREAKARASKK